MLTLNRERLSNTEYAPVENRNFGQSGYAPREMQRGYDEDRARANELWSKLQYTSPNRVTFDENRNNAAYDETEYDAPTRNVRRSAKTGKSRAKGKMSLQGKVILAIYLVLAVVVISLIIVNSEVINGNQSEIASPTVIVEVSDAGSNESVSVASSKYDYEEQTNWFDRLCDGLNSLFTK